MKTLGITINGILRDLEYQFEKLYRKEFIRNESLVGMDENFNVVEETLTESDWDKLDKIEKEKITLPVDTPDLMNHFKFDSKQSFEKFLYEDYNFQILGAASSFPKAFDHVLRLQSIGETNKMFNVVLLSKENGKSVTSTLHFLAKSASRARNIKFIDDYKDAWNYCDVIVTDLPEICESKPKSKMVIKINKLYNQWCSSDYTFDDLGEVNDKELLINLFPQKDLLALQK